MIINLSAAGARLKVEVNTQLPNEFILVLSRDRQLNRRCRAVWRQDDTVGVKFVGQQSIKSKAKPEKPRDFSTQVTEDAWPKDGTVAVADAPSLVPEPRE